MSRRENAECLAQALGSARDWSAVLEIDGFGAVRIRPIHQQDAKLYRAFADKVSTADRRFRFFYAGPELTPSVLARFTQIDQRREMAFVAVDEKSNALLGVGRMICDLDGGGAEFAILVRSDAQGKGLGWRLMQQLIRFARSAKLPLLHGSVLAENNSKLQMCQKLGFQIRNDPSGGGIRRVVLPLPEPRS